MGTVSQAPGNGKSGAIVAIAAESREFEGLLRHALSARAVKLGVSFARVAEISGRRWLLAANGPGRELASQAAAAAAGLEPVRAVISMGFCGALDPALHTAEVLVATEVWAGARRFPAAVPCTAAKASRGAVVSQDRVVSTVREKTDLHSQGAAAVDMEAGAVASLAQDLGLPFYCIRAVSDEARAPMPLDFNLYRDERGCFDRGRIARAAVLRPWVWPALIQFDRNCRRASVTLGDFLADCSF